MRLLLLFLTILLPIATLINGDQNLWDQVVRQEQVILTVIYKGRSLNVWKQNVDNYSKFYVTPLCNIDLTSVVCLKDALSAKPQTVFSFDIKLWDLQVATLVQKALKLKNIIAHAGDIFILPMQSVRIGLGKPNPSVKIDKNWRPFGDQSLSMTFDLYPKNKAFCQKMVKEAKTNTDFFLRTLKLYFEFFMESSSTSSRTLTMKGTFLQNSSFYGKLVNKNTTDGIVYLKSEDANQLAHEVFNSASFEEEVSSDYNPSEQEGAIIKELVKIFEQDKIQSTELSKENWDSVFWDDIFTRPDIQTSYFNNAMTYNDDTKEFKFDQESANAFRNKVAEEHSNSNSVSAGVSASYMGIGGSVETSVSNSQSNANSKDEAGKSKEVLKFDDFQKLIDKNNLNIKWNGKKFEQKSFDLYRVNTKNLKTQSETAFKRVIVNKEQSAQKIEIKKEANDSIEWNKVYDEITTIPTTTTTTPTTTTTTTTTTATTTTPTPTTTTSTPTTTTTMTTTTTTLCVTHYTFSGFSGFGISFDCQESPNLIGIEGFGIGAVGRG